MPSRLYVANEHPRPSGVSRGMRLETAPARASLAAGAARGGVAALRPLQASLVDPWSLGAIESVRPEVAFIHLSLLTSLPSLRVHRERADTSRTYEGASVLGKSYAFN
ncbi:MAG: hypothetical protein KatS3mg049_3608 [Caldilinea sp.]|nr:MAG: hypothetical protein KatS3mg049_3608 [Caldilinea sp.]